MNRFLFLAALLCLGAHFSQAQDYENCIQVISASSKSGTQAGLTFTYTVGEAVISTLSGSSNKLTQGFHQPELCQLVSTDNFDVVAWNLEVFPNPTSEVLNIRFSAEQGQMLRASVYNLLGQTMLSDQVLTQPGGSQIDCVSWQPGVYILQLQDPATRGIAALRFVRL